jgi:hypothetical protein
MSGRISFLEENKSFLCFNNKVHSFEQKLFNEIHLTADFSTKQREINENQIHINHLIENPF